MFFLLFIFSLHLQAKELIIRTPQVDSEELQLFLDQNPQFESMTDRWKIENLKDQKNLERIYLKAQYEFLNGKPSEAENLYKQITDQINSNTWTGDARKMITTSYFRLAQLDSANEEAWVQKAELFDSELPPNTELFPPPFQKAWMQSKIHNPPQKWYPLWSHGLIDQIIINGQSFTSSIPYKAYYLHPKHNQVTVISNCGFIETRTGSAEEIQKIQWLFPRPAQGTCQEHQISFGKQGESVYVLFPNQCVVEPKISLATLNKDANKNVPVPKSLDEQLAQKTAFPISNNTKSWYKNKWLWLGLVSITSFYIYEDKRRADSSAPSSFKVKIKPSHNKNF